MLVATACVEPILVPQPDSRESYTISFRIQTQDDDLLTKAGGLLSGEDALVDSLFMYCFDSNGRYLGRYQAQILTTEQMSYTEDRTPGTFKGEIPPATARIHFVANADCPVGGDMIGMTETQVMHTSGQVYRTKDSRMSYWGYLRRSTPNKIKELFDEEITDQTVTIWMVRDRAWIEAGTYKSDVFYDDISWVVYNGLTNGFIATYGTTPAGGTHTQPWLDEANPYQELRHTSSASSTGFTLSASVTPYPESGGRFTTTVNDMVPFDKTKEGYQPMYVFDDECPFHTPKRVTKIIVRATFKVDGNSETDHDNHTKYFPLCITHGFDAEPLPLHRGNIYQLSLQALPEAAGYDTFAGAAAATTFANGALVDIPQSVIEVSDGKFNMRVNYQLTYPLSRESFYSTAVLIQETKSNVTVPFEMNKQTETVTSQDFHFCDSDWIPAEEGTTTAHSSDNVTFGAGISSTDTTANIGNPLSSSVTFSLKSVGSSLKESVYNLKGFYLTKQTVDGVEYDVKNILMRNIDIYSIDRFLIQEAYSSSTENHNTANNLVLVSLGDNKYRLKFKLPGGTGTTGDHDKYPEVLYPLQVKVASRTLQPYAIWIDEVRQGHEDEDNNWVDEVFGVQVRSTKPNTQPAMLSAQDDATQWNYQSSDNYWNFWYTYPIVSVPRNTDGEIIGPEVWIDFMDVRSPSVFQTIPVNVGLYLYIEFFGAANAVSFESAYVKATGVIVHRENTNENGTANNNNQRYPINRNTTLQLKTTVSPTNATHTTINSVTWTSSNNNRATVNNNGLVTITNAGTGNIGGAGRNVDITATVTTVDGTFYDTFYIRVNDN